MRIPYVWERESGCPACNGTGKLGLDEKKCYSCDGTGKKKERDISDKYVFPWNTDADGNPIKVTEPAGYIQANPTVQVMQQESLEKFKKEINQAIWGGEAEAKKTGLNNTTAFEVSVSQQDERNKLKKMSENAALVEKALTDLLGDYYLRNGYQGSIIIYGTKYEHKSSDEIWEMYINAKTKGAPEHLLDKLLLDYYDSEYSSQPEMKQRMINIFKVTPFPHNTIQNMFNPRGDEIIIKKNLMEFIDRFEREVMAMHLAEPDDIRDKFQKYVKEFPSESIIPLVAS